MRGATGAPSVYGVQRALLLPMPENLDIRTAVQVAVALLIFGAILNVWRGARSIREARSLPFFRIRYERNIRGWWLVLSAVIFALLAAVVNQYAEPVAYRYFPPSPTITRAPTATIAPSTTVSPTTTLSPTITETPSETNTPTITTTPLIPLSIEAQFLGTVTALPEAVFSPLVFTQGIDALYRPLNPGEEFENPVGHMYSVFSYDGMANGVQWTALWYRNGELVHFETEPWDGGTGGLGYTDWDPDSDLWQPGDYQVQIFVGLNWKVVGFFSVFGDPPPPTITLTPTITQSPTITLTPTPTTGPSPTPTRTLTPTITPTFIQPTPTWTKGPTATPITPSPTLTRQPTLTTAPG